MSFTLKYLSNENRLQVVSESNNLLKLEYLNTAKNFCSMQWQLGNPGAKHDLELWTEEEVKQDIWRWDRLHITDQQNLSIFKIQNGEVVKVNPIDSYSTFVPMTLVTGHHGGGTSIVVKSLKHLGAHIGDDSGDISNRKAHESMGMRTWVNEIVKKCRYDECYTSLATALSAFNYQEDTLNLFKVTDLTEGDASKKLCKILPNLKFLSVVKPKSSNTFSLEGRSFNQQTPLEILKEQYPPIEGNQMFHLDWKKYFTDYNYVNEVLEYLDMPVRLNETSFDEMLTAIGFEKSRLK